MTAAPMYRVQNPATGETVEEFESSSDMDIAIALEKAHAAFCGGAAHPVSERVPVLRRVADLLRERAEPLAEIIAVEMGKSFEQGIGEVEFCAEIFEYYADNAVALSADQVIPTRSGSGAVIQRRPLGTILGIMPWNYPYYQVARFAAPNLAVGNSIILKPAECCPRSSLALQQLLHDAEVPSGAYQTVFATHDQIASLIGDPRLRGVSLTGSERAGAAVAAVAGAHLKKIVLELGGSDAYVILDTASPADAARTAWDMRMENLGQACNSNKRIIVVGDAFNEFVDALTSLATELEPGDPLALNGNEYGPMAARSAAESLLEQLDDAVSKGATLHVGGKLLDDTTAYFAPAVLSGVTPSMRAYHEELFGPVAVVYRAEDEDEALRVANDTEYGLGAAVFSRSIERARLFGDQLDTGMVAINAPVAEGAELPFGGVKRSGYGRELGPLGLDEFVNKRLVYLG